MRHLMFGVIALVGLIVLSACHTPGHKYKGGQFGNIGDALAIARSKCTSYDEEIRYLEGRGPYVPARCSRYLRGPSVYCQGTTSPGGYTIMTCY